MKDDTGEVIAEQLALPQRPVQRVTQPGERLEVAGERRREHPAQAIRTERPVAGVIEKKVVVVPVNEYGIQSRHEHDGNQHYQSDRYHESPHGRRGGPSRVRAGLYFQGLGQGRLSGLAGGVTWHGISGTH